MKRPLKRSIVGAIAVLSLLIPSVAQADEWRQYQYDAAGSGFNPNEVTISPDNANRWRVRWSKHPTATRTFRSDPLIDEDSVYVAGYQDGGAEKVALWSFDLATGHLNWVTRMPCAAFYPHLIMGDGVIVVTNLDDDSRCADGLDWTFFVDTETGDKKRMRDGGLWGATMIDGDTAVTARLKTFELATRTFGPQIGEPVSEEFHSTTTTYPLRIVDQEAWLVADERPSPNPRVVVSDGIAVMAGATKAQGVPLDGSPITHYGSCPSDPLLSCAVDIETHEILWTAKSDYPIAHEGVLYGGCPNLCARNLHTGEVIWSADVASSGPLILAGGVLWVRLWTDSTATIRGYDPATGALLTRRPFTQQMGPAGGSAMAVANGYLVSSRPSLRVVSFDRS